MVISPVFLDFLEQALEPIPMSAAQDKSQTKSNISFDSFGLTYFTHNHTGNNHVKILVLITNANVYECSSTKQDPAFCRCYCNLPM